MSTVALTGLFTRQCPECRLPKEPVEFLNRRGPTRRVCVDCHREGMKKKGQLRALNFYHWGPEFKKRADALSFIVALAERRIQKGKGVILMPEEYAVALARLPERIAAIVGKSYAVQQDAATLADDEALGRIRDLLIELDPKIIDRNKNKRLASATG